MYITKREELFTLVEERKNNQEEIKERLNSWVDRVYGIHAFSDIVHRHFVSERQMVAGVLARQVPSIMVEDISCFSFCKLLGLRIKILIRCVELISLGLHGLKVITLYDNMNELSHSVIRN